MQHTDLAGTHRQRQCLFGSVNNNWKTFFILTRQLQTNFDLHRLIDHILQNQNNLNRLVNISLCWKNTQRALQLVHADACATGD